MAAVDYFLKLDGIKGESQDAKHKDEIDLESWTWGESQMGTQSNGGGGGAGKVSMQDFQFAMKVNTASPKLLKACATGQHIKNALLTCRKAGKEQQEFLKITLTDVIALNYAKIEYEYKAQKADGTLDGAIKAGFDLKKMVAV